MATPRVRVAAGIIWENDRFLISKRPHGKPRAGFWEFPGGKQEPGESMEEALTRELREELDVVCMSMIPWKVITHDYSDLQVELHFINVRSYAGIPRSVMGQELRWVTPDEARTLAFLPADMSVLRELAASPPDVGEQ